MLFLLFLLFCQINVDSLINDLGSSDYHKREEASGLLKKAGFSVLPKLIENFDNTDLEISLRCKSLYNEYYYLVASDGTVPSIWYLDNTARFPLGYKVVINKKKKTCVLECDKDISLEYVDKIKPILKNNLLHEDWCIGRDDDDCCCYCYCFCDYCYYWDEEVGIIAMREYIKDCLAAGQDKEELRKIIENTSKNSKLYKLTRKVDDFNQEAWENHGAPPGVILR